MPFLALTGLAALLCTGVRAAEPAPFHPIPVILVTDIGTDIDDSWALGLLLRSKELEPRLVVVDPADTAYRAKVAAKFLEAAGRADIPIAIGDNQGPHGDALATLQPWIEVYGLAHYPGNVYNDGVDAVVRTIRQCPETVTVIAIGPIHTLALALQKDPGLASHCRFVGMFGSFAVGYGGSATPSAETNVRVNPAGFRTVMAAPWKDILLTPLDTCGSVELSGERYHAIWCATQDPMLRAIIESYVTFASRQTWMTCDFFATRSTTLFDCVAVYLAYSEQCVETETVRFDVTDDGYTRASPSGVYKARVALRWANRDGFEAQLAGRLLAP